MVDLIFIFSFLGTILLLIFSVAYIYYIVKKDKEFELKRKDVYQNSQEIINSANEKAKEILSHAVAKAEKLLLETQYIKNNLESEVDKNLQHVAQDVDKNIQQVAQNTVKSMDINSKSLLDEYKKSVSDLEAKSLREQEDMFNQIQTSLQQEFKDFKSVLEKETVQTQQVMDNSASEELSKVKKEIQEYKTARINHINEEVMKIVFSLSRDILGKSISPADHKQLIMQALEQAHKEGLF